MGRINNEIHVFATINIKCHAHRVVLTSRWLELWIYGAIYLATSMCHSLMFRVTAQAPVVIVAVMTSKSANKIHEWHN
jgi:hypothetical protein